MKPLKDEIVEALRDVAPYLDEKSEATINKLAAKVEAARCDNCTYFDSTPPTGCIYPWSEFDANGAAIDWCGTKFGCWNFEPKEANK